MASVVFVIVVFFSPRMIVLSWFYLDIWGDSNPQSIDGDLEQSDVAKLWFMVLDKLVAAQKAANVSRAGVGRATDLARANAEFGKPPRLRDHRPGVGVAFVLALCWRLRLRWLSIGVGVCAGMT